MISFMLTALAIYLMIWWITLFAVLPIGGNPSHHEAGVEVIKGNDPGAPVNLNLWKKVKLNTIVATVVWAILMAVILIFKLELTSLLP